MTRRYGPLIYLWLISILGCNTAPQWGSDIVDVRELEKASQLKLDVASLLMREADIVKRAPKASSNQLAFDLYKQMSASENPTYSPLSISLALAMTYAGSRGETEQAMKNTLHLGENTFDFH